MRKFIISTSTIFILGSTGTIATFTVMKDVAQISQSKTQIMKSNINHGNKNRDTGKFENSDGQVVVGNKKKFNWNSLSPRWTTSGKPQLRIRYLRNPRRID